jgi:hypothetical protein
VVVKKKVKLMMMDNTKRTGIQLSHGVCPIPQVRGA